MIINLIDEMQIILTNVQADVEKFEINNNNLAGTRVRKAMQELKVKAQEIRIAVSNLKTERKE